MTPRQVWILLGIVIFASLPYMGDVAVTIRVVTALLLLIVGGMEFVARLPVRGMAWFVRLLSLALGLLMLAILREFQDSSSVMLVLALGMPFLVLALAPSIPYRIRGRFYSIATVIGGAITVAQSLLYRELFLGGMNIVLLGVLWIACQKWKELPESYATDQFLAWRNGANRRLARYKRPISRRRQMTRELELGFNLYLALPHNQTYKAFESFCRRFPRFASMWRLRAFICFERGDYASAVETLFEARKFGFDDSSFDRALAYALFRQGNGMWREIFDQGWEKALEEGAWTSRSEYCTLRDPREFWLTEDEMVRRLSPRLRAMTSPPIAATESVIF